MFKKLAAISALVAAAKAQQFCELTAETHPSLTWQKCTANSCQQVQGSVVLDSNWRWTHKVEGSDNCYTGSSWSDDCTDGLTCATECCVDGADYGATYGITTSGDSLELKFVTEHEYGTNVGSRVYLMQDEDNYEMFNLVGNEFTFDVDVSNVGCGLNGALYFVSMDQDGGKAAFASNEAGAKYGTGYCDSQCPRDIKFINGLANVDGWNGLTADSGVGSLGACCPEMDIWEANSQATAYTPHPCDDNGYHSCNGDTCGGTYSSERYAGTCDPDGCDFNSYRQGDKTFYGPGLTVDTNKPMTVVTQFLNEGSSFSEMKRFYVQDGVVIPNSESIIPGVPGDSITQDFCDLQKDVFGDEDTFGDHGGMAKMGEAMEAMVLVMSLWNDNYANMLWLDSTYPVDATGPGAERGPCPTSSGVPAEVEAQFPNSSVTFSNIKFGPIGSTFNSDGTEPIVDEEDDDDDDDTPIGNTVDRWGQCGGNGYSGSTTCTPPYTCNMVNEWYSQCL